MKIAICDDEEIILNNTIFAVDEIIRDSGYSGNCVGFLDGNELINNLEFNNYYDIYILDIDMEGINGIKLAKKIRQVQKDAIIIFLTSYEKWVMDAFDVQAFNYILKSMNRSKIEEVLKKSFNYLKESKCLYYFQKGKSIITIKCKDIYYFENQKRKVRIVTNDAEHYYYDSLNEVEEKVGQEFFTRTHKSYLVNMEHIENFDGKNIYLDNGEIVPVSRKYVDIFNRKFIKFLDTKR